MKKFLSTLCATALAASVTVTGMLPAGAAPVYVPKAPTVQPQSDVIQVQDFRWKRRFNRNRARFDNGRIFDNDRIIRRGGDFRRFEGRRAFRRFDDGPRYGWYRGHRGYPYWRRGYRYHDGFWFPAAAFITGAIVGGAIANSNTYYRGGGGSAHVEWCYDRYRSYRAYDNTFQPYNGPRRQCYSPYS